MWQRGCKSVIFTHSVMTWEQNTSSHVQTTFRMAGFSKSTAWSASWLPEEQQSPWQSSWSVNCKAAPWHAFPRRWGAGCSDAGHPQVRDCLPCHEALVLSLRGARERVFAASLPASLLSTRFSNVSLEPQSGIYSPIASLVAQTFFLKQVRELGEFFYKELGTGSATE